jgi:hypothetical protein
VEGFGCDKKYGNLLYKGSSKQGAGDKDGAACRHRGLSYICALAAVVKFSQIAGRSRKGKSAIAIAISIAARAYVLFVWLFFFFFSQAQFGR